MAGDTQVSKAGQPSRFVEGADRTKAPHKVKIMMRHTGTLQHRYRMNGMRFLLALRGGVETGHQGTTKREKRRLI